MRSRIGLWDPSLTVHVEPKPMPIIQCCQNFLCSTTGMTLPQTHLLEVTGTCPLPAATSWSPNPLGHNRTKGLGTPLVHRDLNRPFRDAPNSGGDGGTFRSAALPPPLRFGDLRRDREPTNEGFAGPGSGNYDPCSLSAGLRMGVRVFCVAWRTRPLTVFWGQATDNNAPCFRNRA